jgi:hypothetical protein
MKYSQWETYENVLLLFNVALVRIFVGYPCPSPFLRLDINTKHHKLWKTGFIDIKKVKLPLC